MSYFVSLEVFSFFFFLESYLLLLFGADCSVFSFCPILCLFLWTRQNSYLSWSCEGRPCVLWRKTLCMLGGFSGKLQLEWARKWGKSVFSFLFQKVFLEWCSINSRAFPMAHLQHRRCRKPGFNPWVGKIPWRRAWQPTPVFCLENSMDRGAWWAMIRGVEQSQTRLQRLSRAQHWF